MKKIYFTVTNDLRYDQRMQRICSTLADNGYEVVLVGRKRHSSPSLKKENFSQKRLRCFFNTGKLFYAEYNLRLFFFLLTRKMDLVCAIDLDTILPCLLISKLKGIKRVYDAHELFTELKEVITRPSVRKAWLRLERYAVPKFVNGYTVSEGIADEFRKRYQVEYETIRNVPALIPVTKTESGDKFILYQGAVNEGRGLEWLIPAMRNIDSKLVICGDGNFMDKLRILINENKVQEKIELRGMVEPGELRLISMNARVGIALAEKEGLNQLLALPNKFFDYIHGALPQVTMNYPEYKKINTKFEVAILIDDLEPDTIANAVNSILNNDTLYLQMRENCLKAREELNWENEKKKLILFYQRVFQNSDPGKLQ